MAHYREKRADSRTAHKAPATIEELDDSFLYRARMVNFSRNGMFLETDVVLDPQAEILIGLEESPFNSAATLSNAAACYRGKIRWQKDIKGSIFNFGYGIQIMADGDQESSQAVFTQKRAELRQYPRKHFAKPVVFISDNQYHRGVARNLSRRGIFIAIKDKFYVGQLIKLVIPGTKIDNGVMLKGEIVHISQMGIGVNFKSLIRRRQIIKDRGGTRSGDDRRKLFFSEYSPEKRTGEERRSGGDRRSIEHVISRKALNLSDAFRSLK